MAYETVKFDVNGSLARLTLNRPEVMNALNKKLPTKLSQPAMRLTLEMIFAC